MILAAGLGTRLKPLTDKIPKALVPVNHKPLLEHLINHLKNAGITEIIINVHHFPEQISSFIKAHDYFNMRIELSPEEDLLDTGGGLKKAQWFFDDGKPFLLHNVDVVSNLDLVQILNFHNQKNGVATLAVRTRTSSRYLLFDHKDKLVGWEDVNRQEKKIIKPYIPHPQSLSFMGIHIISPEIFSRSLLSGKFSIIDAYLDLAAKKESIYAFHSDMFFWLDLGKLQNLPAAEKYLEQS